MSTLRDRPWASRVHPAAAVVHPVLRHRSRSRPALRRRGSERGDGAARALHVRRLDRTLARLGGPHGRRQLGRRGLHRRASRRSGRARGSACGLRGSRRRLPGNGARARASRAQRAGNRRPLPSRRDRRRRVHRLDQLAQLGGQGHLGTVLPAAGRRGRRGGFARRRRECASRLCPARAHRGLCRARGAAARRKRELRGSRREAGKPLQRPLAGALGRLPAAFPRPDGVRRRPRRRRCARAARQRVPLAVDVGRHDGRFGGAGAGARLAQGRPLRRLLPHRARWRHGAPARGAAPVGARPDHHGHRCVEPTAERRGSAGGRHRDLRLPRRAQEGRGRRSGCGRRCG